MSHAVTVAILTISDRCSRGEAIDTSGPALGMMVRECLNANVLASACVPDEIAKIQETVQAWTTANPHPDLILTTGGTGLSSRDVTPEATAAILERPHPGLMELA